MNSKGTDNIGVGAIITLAVAIIAGLVLWQAAIGNMQETTGTYTIVNQTFTVGALNSLTDLTGQEIIDTPIVTNSTSGITVVAANYTIAETVSTVDGLKRISYKVVTGHYASQPVNITYTYGKEGYIDSSGGRSIYLLIPILAAIAIVVIVLYPSIKDKFGMFD